MSLTIGVAICCYKGHIRKLQRLFDSIDGQSKRPDQVIVSCSSSVQEDIPYHPWVYSYPLEIIPIEKHQNAAQNRNFAASKLTTDIICFFDADDIMHPQRIEIIYDCFTKHNIKIFLHNTTLVHNMYDFVQPFEKYTSYYYLKYALAKCEWGATVLTEPLPDSQIANGHVSVTREVFDYIKFKEEVEFQGKEDTVFSTDVIMAYPNQTMYCHNILSRYLPSGSTPIVEAPAEEEKAEE
jgi:glycosyltransferase involved in cell wall biosynthesis